MSEINYKEKYAEYFNLQEEKALQEETFAALQRATRAHQVAEIVAKLYGVSGINSVLVVTKEFILILKGIAVNFRKGNSVNNVRDHIHRVIKRDNWARREKEHAQNPLFKVNDKTITINIAFTFNKKDFELIQGMIHQLNMVMSQVTFKDFDGKPHFDGCSYQLCDTPGRLSIILNRISDKVGIDALTDICYTSPSTGFERDHLTLLQAIQLAEYETQI